MKATLIKAVLAITSKQIVITDAPGIKAFLYCITKMESSQRHLVIKIFLKSRLQIVSVRAHHNIVKNRYGLPVEFQSCQSELMAFESGYDLFVKSDRFVVETSLSPPMFMELIQMLEKIRNLFLRNTR